MAPSPNPPNHDDVLRAESLVDEAMAGLALPRALRPILRATLVAELLATPHGRASLRRSAPDPRVARSADMPTSDAPRAGTRRSGGDPA